MKKRITQMIRKLFFILVVLLLFTPAPISSQSSLATGNDYFHLGKYIIYFNVIDIHTSQKEITIVLVNKTHYYPKDQVIIGFFSDPPPSEVVKYEDYWVLTYENREDMVNVIKLITVFQAYDYEWNITALMNNIYSYDASSEFYQRYTAPESDIQSDDPFIKSLAENITSGETNPVKIAMQVYDYIINNIQYGGGPQQPQDALTVLKTQKGVCEGQANVFIALLRAKGVPARKVYSICHAWAEFYLPEVGWIPVDPAMQQFGVLIHPANSTVSKRLYGYPTDLTRGLMITPYTMASGEHIEVVQGVNVYGVDWDRTYWGSYDKSSSTKYDTDNISEINVLWEIQPMLPIYIFNKNETIILSPEFLQDMINGFISSAKNRIMNMSSNPNSEAALYLIKRAEDLMSQGKVFQATINALLALSIINPGYLTTVTTTVTQITTATTTVPTTVPITITVRETSTVPTTVPTTITTTITQTTTATTTIEKPTNVTSRETATVTDWTTATTLATALFVVGIAIGYIAKRRR